MLGRYVAGRVVSMVPMLLGALTLIFSMVHLIPGDPVAVILGENYSQASYDAMRQRLGLDRPLPVQYVEYLGRVATGNFGDSFRTKRQVADDIASQFPFTVQLAVGSLLVSILIGVPAGVVAAANRNRLPDQISMVISLIGVCAPGFWLGVMLILFFSLQLNLLPSLGAAGWDEPGKMLQTLVLPSLTLGAAGAALLARITRSALLEVLGQDYVRTARSKGLSGRAVLFGHAFRNALVPVTTVLTLELGQLLAGSAIIEIVFSRPGVGHLLIDAVLTRDYPVIQATLLFFVLMVSLATLLGDTLYSLIDPRIRYD
jgi:ABC-type dipeptide/oligopeptide/nickel transport system permease component